MRHLALNGLVFALCYPLTNHLAQQAHVQRSFAVDADAMVLFLPWMIVPYASSGVLFVLMFFLVRTPQQLRTVSRRLLLAGVAGTLVFALVPGRFASARPIPADALPAFLFRCLNLVDQPYNQLPSLHAAYCVIFWAALRMLCVGSMRMAIGLWLTLVGASTVLTWQHHLADVAAGLLLGGISVVLVRPSRTSRHTVAFYYAIAACILTMVGVFAMRSWLLGYAATSLLLVALVYRLRRAAFFGKRNGRFPALAWLLYWPYLVGYRLTWMAILVRERGRPPFHQYAPGLWVGRRLTRAEARCLPVDCHVIDLCSELSETESLRGRYYCLPLLDLQAPRPSQLRSVLATIGQYQRTNQTVYVHCAMGYSRSRLIARIYIRRFPPCRSPSTY
jgi:membrane-associated phospholipid phosphatase